MKYHDILKDKHSDWRSIETAIEALPKSNDKGEVFEQFVYAYLKLHQQLYQIQDVYRAGSIPTQYLNQYQLEKKDSGVDGLMILKNQKAAAYQAKFRTNRKKPSYDELAKFWVEAQHTDFNYTIANCYSITKLAQKQAKHLQILVDDFDNLDADFFEQLYEFTNNSKTIKRKIFEPYDFQKNIIEDTITGFQTEERGKIIAACGTGKTLTSLWITERLKATQTLFLAPSLALIKQTLEAWANQTSTPFNYLCVCSDKTVSADLDEGDINANDLNIPVTTNVLEITNFITQKSNQPKYIFSTYQSIPVIAEVFNTVNDFEFDLIIFDEAHRTAGAKETNLFGLALNNNTIPASKRLFMTATERLLKPSLKQAAEEADRIVFSMDDEDVYGKLFHRFNFGQAIEEKVISDYQVIVAGIQEAEIYEWIKENKDLENLTNTEEFQTTAQTLFAQLILSKALKQYPIHKVITFHSSVHNAKVFTGKTANLTPLKTVIQEFNPTINDQDLYLSHINGSMPVGDRQEILDSFKSAQYAVLSNARCLTEGVDVPMIDSVYFVDPKHAMIDIVQACGRALRKPKNQPDKTAFFIIPILIPDQENEDEILNSQSFETVFNVLQSLRDQDDRLAEWVNELNKNAVRGKIPKFKNKKYKPISLVLPKRIDLSDFEEKLYLKIATVNANPSIRSKKTDDKRKSDYKRIFRTIKDYNFEKYMNGLVKPTIQKYQSGQKSIPNEALKIDNNNVSHTRELGLIQKDENKSRHHIITPLGEKYLNREIADKELFKRQMLRFSESDNSRIIFPYRSFIKILLEVESVNFYEFIFAIYTMLDSSESSIRKAVDDINFLRNNYPNLPLTSQANRKSILGDLNKHFNTSYEINEIWGSTTVKNQFGYFRNHLSLFDEIISIDNQFIYLKEKSTAKAQNILSIDNKLEYEKDYSKILKKYISAFIKVVIFTI